MTSSLETTAQDTGGVSPSNISFSEFQEGYFDVQRQIVPVTEGLIQSTELVEIEDLEDSIYKDFFILEDIDKEKKERRISYLKNIIEMKEWLVQLVVM